MRRRHRLHVDTFPFLAVLLCAMGALILILLVMDRRSRLAAAARARESALEAARLAGREIDDAAEKDDARLEAERKALDREMRQVQARLAEVARALRQEEAGVGVLRRTVRGKQTALKGHEQALRAARTEAAGSEAALTAEDRARHALAAELVRLEQVIRDLKATRQRDALTYSVIPYKGKHGEQRRPLYVECTRVGLLFHPDRFELVDPSTEALREEIGRRVARIAASRRRAGLKEERPYLMMLIRPEGVVRYYQVQSAIREMPVEFGYEFVDADWVLTVPPEVAELAGTAEPTLSKPSPNEPIRNPSAGSGGGSVAGGPRWRRGDGGPGGNAGSGVVGAMPGGTGAGPPGDGMGRSRGTVAGGGTGGPGGYPPGGTAGLGGWAGNAAGPFIGGTGRIPGDPGGYSSDVAGGGVVPAGRAGSSPGNVALLGLGGGGGNAGSSTGGAGAFLGNTPGGQGSSNRRGGFGGTGSGNGDPTASAGGGLSPDGAGSAGGPVGRAGGTPSNVALLGLGGTGGSGRPGSLLGGLGGSPGVTAGGPGGATAWLGNGPPGSPPPGTGASSRPPPGLFGMRTGPRGSNQEASSGPIGLPGDGSGRAGKPNPDAPVEPLFQNAVTPSTDKAVAKASSAIQIPSILPSPAAPPAGGPVNASPAGSAGGPGGSPDGSGERIGGRQTPGFHGPDSLAPSPPRSRPLLPAKIGAAEETTVFIECRSTGVLVHPTGQLIPLAVLEQAPANSPLRRAVAAQLAFHKGNPARRHVHFLIHPDAERTFHAAYPTLDELKVDKTRYTLRPWDDISRLILVE